MPQVFIGERSGKRGKQRGLSLDQERAVNSPSQCEG